MYNQVMKCLALSLLTLGFAVAEAQTHPKILLGDPQFVAKKVRDAYLAPNGRAVAYTVKTKSGLAIGGFNIDTDEGKILLTLKPDETLHNIEWLPSGTRFLVHTVQPSGQGRIITLGVGDVTTLQFHTMFTRQFAESDNAGMSFYISPLLDHALVDILTSKGRETWVLTQNATSFTYSRDIAAAEAQGQGYGGWTANGTAVYGSMTDQKGVQFMFKEQTLDIKLDNKGLGQSGTDFVVELTPQFDGQTEQSLLKLSGRLVAVKPSYAVGATVLECVPSNGALRSIKFPGAYVEKQNSQMRLLQVPTPQQLKLGSSDAEVTSLWLSEDTPGVAVPVTDGSELNPGQKEAQSKKTVPKTGVLVSAQVDGWWTCQQDSLVAYTYKGALFVRTIKRSNP